MSIGLNYIDTYHRSGLYPLQLPTGIGLEAAGIIKEIGSNVSNFSVGDKVAYAAAPLGSYSTHRNYPSKNIVKVPDNIDLEIISSAMTKGMTTFYLLHKTYVPKKGETVLFHAAAGGVGQFFCQWAKSLGLKVIGTVGSHDFQLFQLLLILNFLPTDKRIAQHLLLLREIKLFLPFLEHMFCAINKKLSYLLS